MITKSGLIGFLALAASATAVAPARAEGPGWVYNRTVVSVVSTAYGGLNIRVSPELSGCTSSAYGPNYALVQPPTVDGLKFMKADMLVALVTGKPVSLYLTDNTCRITETVLGPY